MFRHSKYTYFNLIIPFLVVINPDILNPVTTRLPPYSKKCAPEGGRCGMEVSGVGALGNDGK